MNDKQNTLYLINRVSYKLLVSSQSSPLMVVSPGQAKAKLNIFRPWFTRGCTAWHQSEDRSAIFGVSLHPGNGPCYRKSVMF